MKPAVRIDAYEQGVKDEQDRIIKHLDRAYDWNESVEFDRDELIAIIRGENNA
jgi:hypothetical protein